jgi:predicted DsbA family dithiol-disulfide isomerase
MGKGDDIFTLLATIEGIDAKKVEQLPTDNADADLARIDRDLLVGGRFGVQGTPGAVIGTRLISGAQPFTKFRNAIERVIAGSCAGGVGQG